GGPRRAPGRGEPFPAAVAPGCCRVRRSGPDQCPVGRGGARQRRLLPHPRHRGAQLTVAMLPGPYRVPAYRGRVQVVLTNKTPCGTYRAPGRYEGTVAREQLLDVAADRLGIDRIELRRRNLLGPAELPHRRAMTTLGTDVVLDTGDYPALLAAAAAEVARLGYHDEAGGAG